MAVSNLVSSSLSSSDLITQPGWTLLASTTGSNVATLTISSIPQTYRTLRVFWHAYNNTDAGTYRLYFNASDSQTYFQWGTQLTGTSFAPSRASGTTGVISPASDAGYPNYGFCDIYNYSSTETDKCYRVWGFGRGGASDRSSALEGVFFGSSSVPITSMMLRHSSQTNFSTEVPGGFRIYGAK